MSKGATIEKQDIALASTQPRRSILPFHHHSKNNGKKQMPDGLYGNIQYPGAAMKIRVLRGWHKKRKEERIYQTHRWSRGLSSSEKDGRERGWGSYNCTSFEHGYMGSWTGVCRTSIAEPGNSVEIAFMAEAPPRSTTRNSSSSWKSPWLGITYDSKLK